MPGDPSIKMVRGCPLLHGCSNRSRTSCRSLVALLLVAVMYGSILPLIVAEAISVISFLDFMPILGEPVLVE